jgi:hypothetical protein
MCAYFDAKAVLLNVNVYDPINPSDFKYIEANVTQSTSQTWTTTWVFNQTETSNQNPGKTVSYSKANPFTSDVTNLKVNLDTTFFQTDTKYNFALNITDSKNGQTVTVQQNWTLIMNSPPKSKNIVLKNIRRANKSNSFYWL